MAITENQAKQLGALVARARAKEHLSTRALAQMVGVSNVWITKLETGTFADPSPSLLVRVAEALSIEPGRIDRLMSGAVAESLPGMRTYFRAKLDMSPEDIEKVQSYIESLREAA